jgi:hypothetical protein
MKPSFLEKLVAIERSLSRDKGGFEFFGVVLPVATLEQWDLVVAAPWLNTHTLESYKVVAAPLQATFTRDDWHDFSRIAILQKDAPFLEEMLAMFSTEHGLEEISCTTVADIAIRKAYIITAKRRRSSARKQRKKPGGSTAKGTGVAAGRKGRLARG